MAFVFIVPEHSKIEERAQIIECRPPTSDKVILLFLGGIVVISLDYRSLADVTAIP